MLTAGAGPVALVTWLVIIRPSWVRSAAERYATRLIEALEMLKHDDRHID
jgi:hypothetical protein